LGLKLREWIEPGMRTAHVEVKVWGMR